MNIVLFDSEELAGPLPPDDRRARHILDILGVKPGGRFRAGIVDGPAGTATLEAVDSERRLHLGFEADTRDERGSGAPGLHPVRLLLGHPRPIVLRRMLRDLSTVGVEHIVVVRTELGEKSYLKSKLWQGNAVRQLLTEGAEQAGATQLPALERAWSLERAVETLARGREGAQRILFDNAAGAPGPGAAAVSGGAAETTARIIAVGSERGWTDAERETLARLGFRARMLGRRVLRTETAAVAAVSICLSEMGLL
jgi:RsmE family RNA methyltransferase